jgi:hypothetical protein
LTVLESSLQGSQFTASDEWTTADSVPPGMELTRASGMPFVVTSVYQVFGYFEFFDIWTAGKPHTFSAGELVCRNKHPGWR